MGKLQDTQNLYEEYRQKVTGKPDTWKGFLTTMSNNHKYDFHAQLLIYAQRPEATACATFDVWSKQVKRRINRGSKGIPILVSNQWGKAQLDHLYDISSTSEQKDSMPIKLWNVQPQLEPFIKERLAEKHDTSVKNELGQMIMDICADISREHCENTMEELSMIRDNSFLDDLDELNLEMTYKSAMTVSLQYSVLSRCGIDPDEYLDIDDFIPVYSFDTPATATMLGVAIAKQNKSLLVEIGTHCLEAEKDFLEKKEKGIANSFEMVYDSVGRLEQETGNPENINKEEQGDGRENEFVRATGGNLQVGGGRNVVPEPDGGGLDRETRSGGRTSGEIRNGEIRLHQEPQGLPVLHDDDGRNTGRTPPTYRQTGETNGGNNRPSNDGETGLDRGNTIDRPKMGGESQHDIPPSERNRTGGTGIHLSDQPQETLDFFPSNEEMIQNLIQQGAEERVSSAPFPIPDPIPTSPPPEPTPFAPPLFGQVHDGMSGNASYPVTDDSNIDEQVSIDHLMAQKNRTQEEKSVPPPIPVPPIAPPSPEPAELPEPTKEDLEIGLRFGTADMSSKEKINDFFQKQPNTLRDKRILLQKEYGTSTLLFGNYVVKSNRDLGIRVQVEGKKPQNIPWNKVVEMMDELVSRGAYLTPEQQQVKEQPTPQESQRTAMYSEVSPIGADRIARGDFSDHEMPIFTNKEGKEFALGFGSLGNGTTVWNYLEEVNRDYKQVAHIGEDGTLKIYDKSLPENATAYLKERAESEKKQEKIQEAPSIPVEKPPTFDSKKEKEIEYLVSAFGVDETVLRELLALDLKDNNVTEFGRLDRLTTTVDKTLAKQTFDTFSGEDTSMHRVNIKTYNLLRAYITNQQPEFPIKKPEQAQETVQPVPETDIFPFKTGDSVTIDDTQFIIKNISDYDVTLVDPSLSYPIMRSEPKDYFLEIVDEIPEKTAEIEKAEPSSNIELEKSMEVTYRGQDYVIDSFSQEGETIYLREKGSSRGNVEMANREEVLVNLQKDENGEIKKFHYAVGDVVTLEGKEVGILAIENAQVVLQDRETFSPMVKRISEEEFLKNVDQPPESVLSQVTVESSPMDFAPKTEEPTVGPAFPYQEGDIVTLERERDYLIGKVSETELTIKDLDSVDSVGKIISKEDFLALEKQSAQERIEKNTPHPEIPVGMEITIDGNALRVESVDEKSGYVDFIEKSLEKVGMGNVLLTRHTIDDVKEAMREQGLLPTETVVEPPKQADFPYSVGDILDLNSDVSYQILSIAGDEVAIQDISRVNNPIHHFTQEKILDIVARNQPEQAEAPPVVETKSEEIPKEVEKSTSEALYETFQNTAQPDWQDNTQKQRVIQGAFNKILDDESQTKDLFALVQELEPQNQEAFDKMYQVIVENQGKELPTEQVSNEFAVGDVIELGGSKYKVRQVDGDEIQLNNSISRPPLTLTKEELQGRLQEQVDSQAKLERNLQDIDKIPDKSQAPPVAPQSQFYPDFEDTTGKSVVKQEATTYKITDEALGNGTPKEKFQRNVLAIQTLHQIEAENRLATPEEQEKLANYVGWGGLQEAFDDSKPAWATEYATLKALLPEKDYAQAMSTVLDSHYTSPVIIEAMYQGLEQMGLSEKSKILEPAMGVGNFLGAMPDYFAQAKVSGTELDSISGRIAKQLYPQAKIEIGSFEHTKHRNNSFDIAIGNVPFGDTKIFEQTMARKMNIHDYFFGKSLDKVKTGGIVAFITSSGTMDKRNSDIRKYLSERADLLGAIRLPNTAFKSNAGTEVTADIIFLQKREEPPQEYPDWVTVKENITENGDKITMNQYFIDHPDMIMGQMKLTPSQFGPAPTCMPDKSTTLKEQLALAVVKLEKPDLALLNKQIVKEEETRIIPETPENARNFSFVVIDNELYFNRNGELEHKPMKESEQERVMALVELVDQTRNVIDLQVNNCTDFKLLEAQEKLNLLHDNFNEKYGVFAEKENKKAFEDDSSYPLLRSLQNLDSEGNLQSKADIFFQRTIKQTTKITSVDTPAEALVVSISEKACVDIPFMAELMGGEHKSQEIIDGLKGVIFKEPTSDMNSPHTGWKTADEYLSGNVRKKLETAKEMAEIYQELDFNVEMLEKVQPKQLEAGEISVRLGATWIPQEVYTEFMHHIFEPSERIKYHTAVEFSADTGEFGIKGKNIDKSSTLSSTVYGSKRRSGYDILEKTLNLKDVKVFDTKEVDGKKVQVYNKKESEIAEECQKKIQGAFEDWIWESPERRESLSKLYNETFNSIRPREFDGSHIQFEGMTDKIELNPHQKNAVARTLYGGNTMLAHCVGAGKTFTMIASAMEGKRLGLHNKSLIIVPNHLTSQVGADVYKLYPNAKVLVAGSDDFGKDKRREVCSRIATGNYDIVVLGHTQFAKIPLSPERVEKTIRQQVEEITKAIKSAKQSDGESFTVKNLEKKKKELDGKIKTLLNEEAKDDVVHFEDLGIDKLYVDEAHKFKNLFLATKMSNISGIPNSAAQRSTDMLTKCQYLDEITGGKGVVFATGTPVSNSMTELFTMMKYLQQNLLESMNLQHFDSWASSFCLKVTDKQLTAAGDYKEKTRFAKFFNLPEVVTMWKEATDIQTEDMLNLPTPEFKYKTLTNDPTPYQKWYINELSERADDVEMKLVEKEVDSMGIITMDGRRIALDPRLEDERLPDEAGSKVNVCVNKVAEIWGETAEKNSTQMIFLDQGVPHFDGTFNLYDDIRDKLVEKGIPLEQVAFIHEAKKDEDKDKLFAKVRSGEVRVLIGSTEKMGAGTNCQNKLIALHHLDIPWKPSDIQQREGRILRQGNENPHVKIFKYVTEGTFDSFSWNMMQNKQTFIGQVFTSKAPARSMDDVDDTALTYAETKAIAAGDPQIQEKMELDVDVSKLKVLRTHHQTTCHNMEDKVLKFYPQKIIETEGFISALQKDKSTVDKHPSPTGDNFKMVVGGVEYSDRKSAGEAIKSTYLTMKEGEDTSQPLGEFLGFEMTLTKNDFGYFRVELKAEGLTHPVEIEESPVGNVTRICNTLENIDKKIEQNTALLEKYHQEKATSEVECKKPFPKEAEFQEKSQRLEELNKILGHKVKRRSPEQIQAREEAQALRMMEKVEKKDRKESVKTQYKEKKKEEKLAQQPSKAKKIKKSNDER